MSIAKPLKSLLSALEELSSDNKEIFDTDVREEMGEAIHFGFIAPKKKYELPESFEMYSDEANEAIRTILGDFLKESCVIATDQEWDEKRRLDEFQTLSVATKSGRSYDDFFGHAE